MLSDNPLRAVILMLTVIAVVVLWVRRMRGRRSTAGYRSRMGGVGPGAMGAVYDMLNEDKRRAVEIIVEHKAAATDPERARDTNRRARLATAADVAEIVRVTNAAYRVEDFFIDGDRTNVAEIADRIAAPHSCFLVIDVPSGKGLAASVYVEIRGDRAYFGMLSVAPAHQKTGLARVLIDAVDARARAAGCIALDIDVVNLREELPAFHRTMGFSETGTAPFLKGHTLKQPVHLILMSKSLASTSRGL